MGYDNQNLVRISNLPKITVRNVFCGAFSGHWTNMLPRNRLIYIFESGKTLSSIRDRNTCFEMRPGNWGLIPAGHEVRHDQYEGLQLISIHFELELYPHIELLQQCGRLFTGHSPEFTDAFKKLTVPDVPFADACAIHTLLWYFLTPVLAAEGEKRNEDSRRFAQYAPLLETIQEHPFHDFTVEEMAGIMKTGKETFVKNFRRDTGISPKKFFNQIRTGSIARELLNPSLTIREISQRFHFSNEFYFSRFVKRNLNQSPNAFRRSFLPASGK